MAHFLQISLSCKFVQFSWNDVVLVSVTNDHSGRYTRPLWPSHTTTVAVQVRHHDHSDRHTQPL